MTYQRFRQLWNALVRDRPRPPGDVVAGPRPYSRTLDFLARYGRGDPAAIAEMQDVRRRLAAAKAV